MAEMKLRQFVQAMPMHAGLLRVGDQHGVVDRRRHREAGARQHHHVELGVLKDLQHRRIGQQRPQHLDRLSQLDLLAQHLVRQRHVAGPARPRWPATEPTSRARIGVRPVGLGIDRDAAGGGCLGDPDAQRLGGGDALIRPKARLRRGGAAQPKIALAAAGWRLRFGRGVGS